MTHEPMTPERWEVLQDLLLAALERPEERRGDFLTDACGADEALKAEVESLLVAHASEGPADRLADTLGGRLMTELIDGGSLEGETVGRYEVGEMLGRGGMSVVYRAFDPTLERHVALKCLPSLVSSDRASRRRLVTEAQMAARLDHPNICTIHEIEEADDGRLFIAMPLYDGETLRARLESGPLAEEEAVDLALQAALGLAKAHDRGVIHRDIKPSNLVVTGDGTLKILDFGIAQPEGTDDPAARMAGTAHYMSPEQVEGGPVGVRSDLWSLGVVLYEMLTGRRPFEGGTREAVRDAVLSAEPEPLEEVLPDTSPALAKLIRELLDKDPLRRPRSARDVVDTLRRVARRTSAPPRRRLLGAVAATVVAVGALLAGVWGPWSPDATQIPEVRRVAVLPLTNRSEGPGQDDFAATMTGQLIDQLAQLRDLMVISHSAVLPYADRSRPMREIAEELGVDAVIDGSVARMGNEVRVSAQLIDGETQAHLWAGEYTRDFSDLLSLENEMAREIARQVEVNLSPEEEARLAASRPVSPDAQAAFLRGVYLQRRYQEEDGEDKTLLELSIEALSRAVELDPDWAEAHAELARAYHWLASGPPTPRQAEYYRAARTEAETAIRLDDSVAGGHAALAFVLDNFERDWSGAEREYRRALELAPNDNYYRWGWALFELSAARYEESVADFRRALEQAPLSPALHTQMARALGCAGRYEEALAVMAQFGEDDPGVLQFGGNIALRQGEDRRAVAQLERAVQLDSSPTILASLAFAYASIDRDQDALAILPRLEAEDMWMPELYALLGQPQKALDQLEWAYERQMPPVFTMRCWSSAGFVDLTKLDALADQPRMQELLRKIDFPPAS